MKVEKQESRKLVQYTIKKVEEYNKQKSTKVQKFKV